MDTTQNQPETSDPKLADPKLATLFDRKLYQHDAFDKSVFRDLDNARKAVLWIHPALKLARNEKRLATFLFPMILPVLIYHGETRFTAATELAELQEAFPEFEQFLVFLKALLFDLVLIPESELPEDLVLWSALTVMRAAFRQDVDTQLLNVYKKVSPLFDKQPGLLEFWKRMFRYVITSGKYFTKEKCVSTIEKIKEVRGENMSTIEQPVYLIDVLLAEGRSEGEAKGRTEEKGACLLRVLTARFQTVPRWMGDRISHVQDAVVLDSLMVAAATCQSIQEFETELT